MAIVLVIQPNEPIQIGDSVVRIRTEGARLKMIVEAPRSMKIARSTYEMPSGYRVEKGVNGRWMLCVPDDRGGTRAHSVHDTRDEARKTAEEHDENRTAHPD